MWLPRPSCLSSALCKASRSFASSSPRQLPRSHHGKFAQLRQARIEEEKIAKENDEVAVSSVAMTDSSQTPRLAQDARKNGRLQNQLSKLPLQPASREHPLSAFFHEMKSVESTGDTGQPGRSYLTNELRALNFDALHRLWYTLLKERNVLASQRDEMRRQNIPQVDNTVNKQLEFRCRKSMARIKGVLNERRIAYEEAKRLQMENDSGPAATSG